MIRIGPGISDTVGQPVDLSLQAPLPASDQGEHLGFGDGDNPMAGDGDAMEITSQILQDMIWPAIPCGTTRLLR
ncbi:MAG: hypothetical protein AUH86_09480 [Acidobacteria bacterium 13_1_40CM_4_58_4]|nr:MAG: hypothetical protein AUH86_09480 [Acidobacteria bacterium 13_1_40CM_4_58_4]